MEKIKLNHKVIKAALYLHLQDLKRKISDKNRFTKFDSANDAFAGACGEYGFSLLLKEKLGYKMKNDPNREQIDDNDYDYVRIEKEKKLIHENSPNDILQHFTNVNGVYYDKYDFIIKDFILDKNKQPKKDLSIDVKTQMRTKYAIVNDEWQFAINSNTIKQTTKDINKVDQFLFIFCKNEAAEFFDLEEQKIEHPLNLKNAVLQFKQDQSKCSDVQVDLLLENFSSILKKNSNLKMEIEIAGLITPSDFLKYSEEFKKNEIFRVNKSKNDNLIFQKTDADMYRISKRHLTPILKGLPYRVINDNTLDPKEIIFLRNKYLTLFTNDIKDMDFVKTTINNKTMLIPFDKVYKNSANLSFVDFIKSTFKSSIDKKNKNKI